VKTIRASTCLWVRPEPRIATDEHCGLLALISPGDHILPQFVIDPRHWTVPHEVLHDRQLVRERVLISVRIESQKGKLRQPKERTKSPCRSSIQDVAQTTWKAFMSRERRSRVATAIVIG
jgi:hypothetical protein